MTDKEQIKELADFIFDYTEPAVLGASDVAEIIYDAGYHKTMWHKVAEGDLPKYPTFYFCHYKGIYINSGEPYEANHEMFWNGKRFITDSTNQVIAWTELPSYKE